MPEESERYIPDVQDYAKAEWMARDLPKREPEFDCEFGCMPMDHGIGLDLKAEHAMVIQYHSTNFTGPIYDKMVHRETDGSDPLVQEPKGKP